MSETTEANAKKTKVERPFPRVALETALRIPLAIKDKNAGNPWPPEEVAKALKVGSQTGNFYYLTAAARDYGLTDGSSKTEKISITALGKKVAFPPSPAVEMAAKRQAFLHVGVFKKVLLYYKGNNLPEKEYLSNTLTTEFGLAPEVHDEFIEIFQKNCRFLGIGSSFSLEQDQGNGSQGDASETLTLVAPGAPTSGRLCFIIMPFVEKHESHATGFFQEVLNSLIVPAAKNSGFVARTASRHGSDVIQSTIVNDLLKADLVVADLTEHNPNVLFELGMRMREDKPVALIKAKGTGRIFDVDNLLRVYEYDPCLWPTTVAKDLPQIVDHIKAAWENKDTALTYMKLLRQSPMATLQLEREY